MNITNPFSFDGFNFQNSMRKSFLVLMAFLSLWQIVSGQSSQEENPFGLVMISTPERYHQSVKENAANQLVNLKKALPGVVLDIRYATTNNFTRQIIYPSAEAYLRKPAAEALQQIRKELNATGIGLKIYDAYRPYAVSLQFFQVYPDTNFVASPRKGSRHNRGCAVDLTLIDLKTGKELEMPTGFDDFTEKAAHLYQNLSQLALKNRQILREVMIRHGFVPLESEWWHYDYRGWQDYDLMDLSFAELNNNL
jgi:D-alanyl-D-alanine dipeptidase